MGKEQLEKAKKILNHIKGYGVYDGNDDIGILEWLIEQAERVQGLDELLTQVEYDMESALKNRIELIKLKRQNKRYLEALEFYANEENYLFDEKEYKVGLGVPESEITLDYGNKARKVLEDEEQ